MLKTHPGAPSTSGASRSTQPAAASPGATRCEAAVRTTCPVCLPVPCWGVSWTSGSLVAGKPDGAQGRPVRDGIKHFEKKGFKHQRATLLGTHLDPRPAGSPSAQISSATGPPAPPQSQLRKPRGGPHHLAKAAPAPLHNLSLHIHASDSVERPRGGPVVAPEQRAGRTGVDPTAAPSLGTQRPPSTSDI